MADPFTDDLAHDGRQDEHRTGMLVVVAEHDRTRAERMDAVAPTSGVNDIPIGRSPLVPAGQPILHQKPANDSHAETSHLAVDVGAPALHRPTARRAGQVNP